MINTVGIMMVVAFLVFLTVSLWYYNRENEKLRDELEKLREGQNEH